jgi:hypothetical protein
LKLRVAIKDADVSGPSRTDSPSLLTKYLAGDGVDTVTSGGEEAAGAEGTAISRTAATVGADGVVSDAGIRGALVVSPETARGAGGVVTICGGPGLLAKGKNKNRATMIEPAPMKMPGTLKGSLRTLAGAAEEVPAISGRVTWQPWQVSCWVAMRIPHWGQK